MVQAPTDNTDLTLPQLKCPSAARIRQQVSRLLHCAVNSLWRKVFESSKGWH